MNGLDYRTGWLSQIPSLALKTMIRNYIPLDQQQAWLAGQGIGFRDPKVALNRLTVEQLIRLINAHLEEVPDPVVESEFKEYRHGRSPTLLLYTLPTVGLQGFNLPEANRRLRRAVSSANRQLEQASQQESLSPRLKRLEMEKLHALDDWPQGLYAGYRVQSRLDYISTDERAVSAYQLLYGHIWIDLGRAFVALHVHPAKLQTILAWILSRAMDVPLIPVRIDKELKRDLKFLHRASCRRARLLDPSPERQRFRSITLADDQDLARRRYLGWDYQQWENDFPELASARYYAAFLRARDKPLSLSIGLRRGSLTLAGAVAASELAAWARDTGAQIVDVWRNRERRYREAAPAAVDHTHLWQHPLLEDWPEDLRQLVLTLARALATIKERQDPLFRSWPLSIDTADLALTVAGLEAHELLGSASRAGGPAPWFQVVVYAECAEEHCMAATDYLVCPSCGRNLFTVILSEQDSLILACAFGRCRERWSGGFPLQTECGEGHPVELRWDAQTSPQLELFVGRDLAFLMQELLRDEAEVYQFQADGESLWVRDGTLIHSPVSPVYEIRKAGDAMTIYSEGGAVILGSVSVEGGDFVGRDKATE
jgi:hypothetical protein